MNIDDYRALVAAEPKRRAHPEHDLQCAVVKTLDDLDRAERLHCFDYTASLAGVNLDGKTRGRMKAAGVRKGWPDLQFACWDGITRFIELKSDDGALKPEQRLFRHYAEPHGIWALCRSVDEVVDQLTRWGVVRVGSGHRA